MRADTVDMIRMRLDIRLPRRRTVVGAVALAVAIALSSAVHTPVHAQEQTAIPLESLLAQQGQTQTPAIGQVERIALGSKGATITLEGGEEVALDFSGLAGVDGGPNYIGWGMLLFGLSVFARLLASLSRIFRPFHSRGRRRDYDE